MTRTFIDMVLNIRESLRFYGAMFLAIDCFADVFVIDFGQKDEYYIIIDNIIAVSAVDTNLNKIQINSSPKLVGFNYCTVRQVNE